jgi:hypothetical protein
MPIMIENEIKAKIADGTIFGISADTAVFDKYGCNLDSPILNKLDQFKLGPVQVLFSEIVVNEIHAHITRDARESQRALNKAISNQRRRWKTEFDIAALPCELALTADPLQASEAQFADYLAAVGGEIVKASGAVDVSAELLRRYFAIEPPFEDKPEKKYEFPDGFALLSLELAAKERGKMLLCVSPDKGWQNFATQSQHLVCVPDLELALSYFNEAGRTVADRTMAMWKSGSAPELAAEVERAFEYLEDADFEADGTSSFEYDGELVSAVMQYVKTDTASAPIVIAADDDTVTFTTNVKAVVAFDADFSFYVRDVSIAST